MKKRITLTLAEISAVLGAAGAADANAVFEDCGDEKEADRQLEAFFSGMEKLRNMLARRRR